MSTTPPISASFEYRLQREPVGVVMLDAERRVIAANPWAAALLSRFGGEWRGAFILDLHPEPARAKVLWLLDTALAAPDKPAGMALTLPGGTLVARVTALDGLAGPGYCMLFHAVDPPSATPAPTGDERLVKLPISARGGLALIDVAEAVYLQADGHYSKVVMATGEAMCSLPMSELSNRLDPAQFVKVHRSYLVNLRHAQGVERRDGQWFLIMDTSQASAVPVSRAHIDDIRRRLAI